MEHGVKETLELINALGLVGAALRTATADGIQVTDVLALVANPEVRESIEAAALGSSTLPAELGDLTLPEVQEIVNALFEALKKIMAA